MNNLRASMKKARNAPDNAAGSRISFRAAFIGSRTMSKKQHMSLRKMDTSKSESHLLLSVGNLQESEKKCARVQRVAFFEDSSEIEEVTFTSKVEVSVLNFGQKTLRASFTKPKRENGELSIGEGRVKLMLGPQRKIIYEVGAIESVFMKNMKSREFVIKFFDDARVFSVRCDNALIAQTWLKNIFIEARQQCVILTTTLAKLLPEDWVAALETKSKISGEEEDSSSKRMLTVLSQQDTDAIEIILRELVDLTGFAKGMDHMDYIEVCDRFQKWLILHDKQEEAMYWSELVEQGYSAHNEKSKIEFDGMGDGTFLGQKLNQRATPVDEIRNPVALSELADLRSKTTPKNLDDRVAIVEKAIAKYAENASSKADKYEELI